MKIYRCIIAGLLVLFLAIGVWYIYSNVYEQRSTDDGILIQYDKEGECVSDYSLCESIG